MKQFRIDTSGTDRVSEMILGQNIETALTTVNGLLSDRLRNAKLTGPPHRMTGIAPEWQGSSCGRASYELTPGAGLMGSEAQLIRAGLPDISPGLHQNRVPVRRGETLVCELRARAWHAPARIMVELSPTAKTLEPYDSGEIVVDLPYYANYTVELLVPRDDDEARLSINLPEGGEIWIDQLHLRPKGEPLLCAAVIDEMAKMQIPTLRFPGGIVTAAYNWKHGTGPVELRPTLLEAPFHQDWYLNYDYGIDEYLQTCLDQHIRPAITLNIATAPPSESAELAGYCRRWFENRNVSPPLIYWHIGNHPYVYTIAHMNPAMYVRVIEEYVPVVRTHYPESRIVAAISRDALRVDTADAWRDAILTGVRELVDVVEMQPYGIFAPAPENPGDYRGGVDDQVELIGRVRSTLTSFERDCRGFAHHLESKGIDIRIGAAEWNCWTTASHWDGRDFEESPTTLHGLFIAGMFHAFVRLSPVFEVAHFYNLVNCMGILNHRGADVEVTFIVDLFKLYRRALPGTRYEIVHTNGTRSDSEIREFDDVGIDTICLGSDSGVYLFCINFDPEIEYPETIVDEQLSFVDAVCYTGASLSGRMTSVHMDSSANEIILPPMSITRIRYNGSR